MLDLAHMHTAEAMYHASEILLFADALLYDWRDGGAVRARHEQYVLLNLKREQAHTYSAHV